MANYLFNYDTLPAYNSSSAERSTEYSTTSFDGSKLHYDGVNTRIPINCIDYPPVSIVVENINKNSIEYGERFLIPYTVFDRTTLGGDYRVLDFICFGKRDGNLLFIHKTDASTSIRWAVADYYIITPTIGAAGSFTFSVNRSGKNWVNSSVEWTASDTISTIATKMGNCMSSDETTALGTSNVLTDTTNNTLKVTISGYSTSTMTLASGSNAMITDLSLESTFMGNPMTESARRFQSQTLTSIFGTFVNAAGVTEAYFPPSTSVQYAKNGGNLSYGCGGNFARFKTYYTNNGQDSFIGDSDAGYPMKKTRFDSCATGPDNEKALYNKYNGDYDAYLGARMYQQEDKHYNGINYLSYSNGDVMTERMASAETKGFNGNFEPAYPAANTAYQVTDSKWGHFHLPTNEEIAMFMEDDLFAQINAAFVKAYETGSTALVNTNYYWSCGECNTTRAWYYYGYYGRLNDVGKFYTYRVRPVLAHKVQN